LLKPSAEQVRTLAPDASAARAGEGLADERRWSATGRNVAAAWGLCQGSGTASYQTVVDLAGPAYKCSCPSRKVPCKHALGLMFLVADTEIGQGQPPEWAGTWLELRASRAEAAAARAERPADADPAARERRLEAREKKVAAGIEELDRWLADLMRRGLDSARGEGYRFWDAMGARLVDAQASGLGRSVRALGSAATAGGSWPHLLLEGSARLHLLCEAYRRAEKLPEPLRADVRSLVGWTTKEEDLDPTDGLDDRWLVVGRRVDDTGQVITARTFMLGEASGRFALHLAFGVDAAPPTVLAMPGQAFRATLAFYPSATPLRAAVRPMLMPDGEVASIPVQEGIGEVVRRHAERLALNPFLDAWPVTLADVVPVLRGDRLLARDAAGTALPIVPAARAARLLAVSGGRPLTIIGEWDGFALRALSVLAGSRLVAIPAADGRPTLGRYGDSGWAALVSAALLGTERSGGTVPVPEPAADLLEHADRERAILAAASVLAVRRRAGQRPATDVEPLPEPAAEDHREVLAGAAARLFGLVVAEQHELLPEILGLLRAAGRRLPDETLPELLALAARDADGDTELRAAIAELAGPRAAWLAQMLPELATGTDLAPGPLSDEAWESARGARQRAALVRAMRRADRQAARRALERALPELAGDERAAAVEGLEEGLGPDDEEILAAALGDRRADVRRAAAGLLVRLEGSALTRLVESRTRPLLSSQGTRRASLAVTLPMLDEELEAAGFGGRPPTGLGERAWLLRQLLGHVRPERWSRWLRAVPSALVERALRSDGARAVLEGWIEASARFADGAWMAALLGEPRVAEAVGLDPTIALARLPPDQRAGVAFVAAPSVDAETLAHLAAYCPPPWPPPLIETVLGTLGKMAGEQYPDPPFYGLAREAALGLPAEQGDELAALASYEGQIRPALTGAIDTIRLRARMHEAFAALPAVSNTRENR
jgi:Family of unknown function (DUF5691)/SWIM zinc finger